MDKKKELLDTINKLLDRIDEDTYYEATDVAERAIGILVKVKDYLEKE
jgi:hypothetical protein